MFGASKRRIHAWRTAAPGLIITHVPSHGVGACEDDQCDLRWVEITHEPSGLVFIPSDRCGDEDVVDELEDPIALAEYQHDAAAKMAGALSGLPIAWDSNPIVLYARLALFDDASVRVFIAVMQKGQATPDHARNHFRKMVDGGFARWQKEQVATKLAQLIARTGMANA